MEQFFAHGLTHPGTVRNHNEDMFVNRPDIGLWAVADGAGGHDAGEVASRMLSDALDGIPVDLTAEATLTEVRKRIAMTHAALHDSAARKGQGVLIASTVVVLIVRRGHFACLWAGDSRAYILRKGALRQLTRDHSLVQELVDAGRLASQDAEKHPRANVITRAVGAAGPTVELDMVSEPVFVGDRFLLCSDGLSKALDMATLTTIAQRGKPDVAAPGLVAAALEARANDNVTAVVIEIAADGPL